MTDTGYMTYIFFCPRWIHGFEQQQQQQQRTEAWCLHQWHLGWKFPPLSGLEEIYGFRQGHVEVIVCCLNEIIIILKYCIGNDVAICLWAHINHTVYDLSIYVHLPAKTHICLNPLDRENVIIKGKTFLETAVA